MSRILKPYLAFLDKTGDNTSSFRRYPRGSFYPLSDTPSTRRYQITKPDFRLCSTCKSRSQARLCLCTLRLVSIQPERTFGRLSYSL